MTPHIPVPSFMIFLWESNETTIILYQEKIANHESAAHLAEARLGRTLYLSCDYAPMLCRAVAEHQLILNPGTSKVQMQFSS